MARPQPGPVGAARPPGMPYYQSLDGLRGGVVVAMLFYHSNVNPLPGGFLSISAFFTLSGFLITSLLLSERDRSGRVDVGRFWERRFRRLMPGALVALTLIAVSSLWVADASQLARLRGDGLAALFYVGNWRFISLGSEYADLFSSPSLVQHFWSLSIEEQFYLSYPLLFLALFRGRRRHVFTACLLVLLIASTLRMATLYAPDASTSRLYYGTDTRAAEILVGGLLAVWCTGRRPLRGALRRLVAFLGVVGLVGTGLFWLAVPMNTPWLWQGGFTLYALITAATILGAVQPRGPVRRILSLQPLPWLGRVSYGAYIYHFPVYLVLDESLTGLAPWPLQGLRLAVTFLLTTPSFYLLELPIRSGGIKTRRGQLAAATAGVATTAMLMVGVTSISPPHAAVELSDDEGPLFSAFHSRMRVMVVGDSIARVIGKGMIRWADRTGQATLVNSAMTGCSVGRGGRLPDRFKPRGDECDDWPERWRRRLESFRPEVVVMLSGSWDMRERQIKAWSKPRLIGDPVFDRWLQGELLLAARVLTSTGARVLWLEAPCTFPPFGPVQGVYEPWRTRHFNELLYESVGAFSRGSIEIVKFHEVVCPGGVFAHELHGISDFRPDGSHFSPAGADWVAEWLAPRLLSKPASAAAGAAAAHSDSGLE